MNDETHTEIEATALSDLPLPPGPRGWPLLGNLAATVRLGMPELLLQSFRQFGEVVQIRVAGRRTIWSTESFPSIGASPQKARVRLPVAGSSACS